MQKNKVFYERVMKINYAMLSERTLNLIYGLYKPVDDGILNEDNLHRL